MLTTWQARGRIAVLVAAVALLAVQAPVLAAQHDVVVGMALVLATGHVISAPLALWRPVLAAALSLLAFTAQALALMPEGLGGWPWAIAPQVITQLLVLVVLTVVAGWQLAGGTLLVQLAVGVGLALVGLPWNEISTSLGSVALFAGLALLLGSLGAESVRVVMLTTFDADDYVHESLRLGASGFLLKDASPDELASAIRIVHGGEALLSPSVTRQVIEQLAQLPPRRRPDPRLRQLTDREREVLQSVARGRSNGEIAADLFLAEQTVKTHVSRILGKLDLRDRAQAVVFAYESGLVAPQA